jgi:hypothetical protein
MKDDFLIIIDEIEKLPGIFPRGVFYRAVFGGLLQNVS